MEVRCLTRWHGLRPGNVYDYPGGAARVLVKRGIVEEVVAEKPKPRRKKVVKLGK